MNNIVQYDIVLIGVVITIPYIKNLFSNKIIYITLSQYTNWNIALICINYFYKNNNYEAFIAINSSTIFVIYHIFRLTCRDKIMLIPNIPKYFTYRAVDFVSFFVHVLPAMVYTHDLIYNKIGKCDVQHNIGYEVCLFNLLWALQCFGTLNPCNAYFHVDDIYVKNIWYITLLSHIFFGYIYNNLITIGCTLSPCLHHIYI